MAKIEVTGWVTDWKYKTDEPNPKWGMKLNESHSKKTVDGGWEVVGNTRFTVKAAYGVEIDFSQYKSGQRVKIVGTQVTEKNGEYENLIVKAETVEVLELSARISAVIAETRKPEYVNDLIVDAPF